MSIGLRVFVTARLDEEEQAARAAFSGQCDPENGWGASRPEGYSHTVIVPHVGIIHEPVQAVHVVRWNPQRVLAEVAAKRIILGVHKPPRRMHYSADPDTGCEGCGTEGRFSDPIIGDINGCPILLALASVYADHPDYREDWKP